MLFKNIISMIKSRRMRFVGHVARILETRNAYTSLVVRTETKRSLRSINGWKNDNEIGFKQNLPVCELDSFASGQERVAAF